MLLVLSIIAYAQQDVTRFLGIPIDGSKAEMIRKLKEKGFRDDPKTSDALVGEFNGAKVDVYVVTNNNKVCRIVVHDANTANERDIQIRFNRLCGQFADNPKYLSFKDYTISDDENISYEITVNKKRYEAVFYQKPTADSVYAGETATETILKRPVWFMISDYYGKYYISMFYDNEYNRANGEDL